MAMLVVCSDLIFATKIFSTAKSLGVPARGVRNLAALHEQLAVGDVGLSIVDLNASGLDPLETIRVIKGHGSRPQVVAFVSHVQAELAGAARQAGADRVMARSAFSDRLPEIVGLAVGGEV